MILLQFCFNNEMARFTAKVITFSMISSVCTFTSLRLPLVVPSNLLGQSEWGVKDDDDEDVIDPMEKAARRISEEMDVLQVCSFFQYCYFVVLLPHVSTATPTIYATTGGSPPHHRPGLTSSSLQRSKLSLHIHT